MGSWISLSNTVKNYILRTIKRGLRPEEVALQKNRKPAPATVNVKD